MFLQKMINKCAINNFKSNFFTYVSFCLFDGETQQRLNQRFFFYFKDPNNRLQFWSIQVKVVCLHVPIVHA